MSSLLLGLRQRFSGYLPSPTKWIPSKDTVFILILTVISIWVFTYGMIHKNSFVDRENQTIKVLTMTQSDYDLFRSAARLVNNDISKFTTVGEALSAFYAESPVSVRDAVIERLGSVKNLEDFPGALENVLGRVVITGAPVEGFSRVSPSIINPDATAGDEPVSPDVLPTVEKKETPPTAKTTVGQQRIFRRR